MDHLLRVQGRAHTGAQNILRALSAMAEDAITDEIAEVNWVRGVRVRANDPRVTGSTRPPRVFSLADMHAFAACGGANEPMLRVFTDCGLRLGEVLGLERRDFDGDAFHVRGSAHNGVFTAGDQPTKKHVRTVPCPPSTAELVRTLPIRIDTPLLFPTLTGRIWHESNFRRDVWSPAREASGFDIRPHDCRHSWVTHLRAAGIDDADLAQVAGHTLETMLGTYTPRARALASADQGGARVIPGRIPVASGRDSAVWSGRPTASQAEGRGFEARRPLPTPEPNPAKRSS